MQKFGVVYVRFLGCIGTGIGGCCPIVQHDVSAATEDRAAQLFLYLFQIATDRLSRYFCWMMETSFYIHSATLNAEPGHDPAMHGSITSIPAHRTRGIMGNFPACVLARFLIYSTLDNETPPLACSSMATPFMHGTPQLGLITLLSTFSSLT